LDDAEKQACFDSRFVSCCFFMGGLPLTNNLPVFKIKIIRYNAEDGSDQKSVNEERE